MRPIAHTRVELQTAAKEMHAARAVKSLRVSDEVFSGAVAIADALIIFVCASVAYVIYLELITAESPPDPWLYAAAALFATTFLLQRLGLVRMYEVEKLFDLKRQARNVLVEWTTAVGALVVLLFLLKVSTQFSRVWLVAWCVSTAVGLVGSRILVGRLLYRWAKQGWFFRRVVVVGAGPMGTHFIESTLRDPSLCVVAAFDDRTSRSPVSVHGVPILGNTEDLYEFLRQSHTDMVLIALPISAGRRIADLFAGLKGFSIDVRLISDAVGFTRARQPVSYPAGVLAINIADRPISGWPLVAKRALDVVLATIALVMLLPVFAIIAVALKLESPGPVLFRQMRLGFNSSPFEIYKFRTMRSDATDKNAERLVTRDDHRVTKVGRILRRYSLDELPQLWNVLEGDMSLVGPRPHALRAKAGDKLYHEVVAEYAARHRVKPGMTGWAQVSGWRGETDTIEKIRMRVEHDLYYIEHWSITFDVWILMLTVAKAAVTKNAF
jgi:Undecaprenyl-phosphate glucose phosphotransferase